MAENKELIQREKNPLVPGFGVAGFVSCPLSFMAPKQCIKQGCEWWVELDYGKQKVARCAISWLAVLSTEVRGAIDSLSQEKKGDQNE